MIGIRALRADLARFVLEAGQGQTFLITKGGIPVAKLVPVSTAGGSDKRTFETLIAEGLVEPARLSLTSDQSESLSGLSTVQVNSR